MDEHEDLLREAAREGWSKVLSGGSRKGSFGGSRKEERKANWCGTRSGTQAEEGDKAIRPVLPNEDLSVSIPLAVTINRYPNVENNGGGIPTS